MASANFVDLYIAAGRNALFAKQGRASTNAQAKRVRDLFAKDQVLSDYYNSTLANGAWEHMMDQVHVGFTGWASPETNIMPSVTELTLTNTTDFGVAVDGSTEAWPGSTTEAALPTFDSLNRQRSYIEMFAKGTGTIRFTTTADRPWIVFTANPASSSDYDRRTWIDIDWSRATVGTNTGNITVTGGSNTSVTIKATAIKASESQYEAARGCFGGLSGPIAILAADATQNIAVGNVGWEAIPDYGRVSSAMEIFPVTAATISSTQVAPRLEYSIYFPQAGTYNVDLITGPTLNVIPTRGLGVAVSIDAQATQVVNVFNAQTGKDEDFLGKNHYRNTSNNARTLSFIQEIATTGKHTLKIGMVDPTIVVQKIVVYRGTLPASYFGPPTRAANH